LPKHRRAPDWGHPADFNSKPRHRLQQGRIRKYMRSSKSRSRSKSNRNRPTGGNIVNRVFDSSGPEGKVRGTPQQIIDKYNQLARDAQLSNDRVAFENFQQHSEHYTRMLGEAQREMDARREQQEQEQRDRQQNNPQQRRPDDGSDTQTQNRRQDDESEGNPDRNAGRQQRDDVIDTGRDDSGDAGLVETPENHEPKPRRPRRPRAQKPADGGTDGPQPSTPDTQEAAE
jgi:hypothetical protein